MGGLLFFYFPLSIYAASSLAEYPQIKSSWDEGELTLAIGKMEEIRKNSSGSDELAELVKKMIFQKNKLDQWIKKARLFSEQQKFKEAKEILDFAKVINPNYSPYKKLVAKIKTMEDKLDHPNTVIFDGKMIEDENLPFSEAVSSLVRFREDSYKNPQAAFVKYADTKTAVKLRTLGDVLSPISDSSHGWQLFFGSSVAAFASLSEQIVLTMFYNPWADVALLCEWTKSGDTPKITQVKLVSGDQIRNSEISALVPLWRRTGNVPPPLSAIIANSDTMRAFIELYGKRPTWPAQQWTKKLPTLKTDNPNKDSKKIVGLFSSYNLSGISAFFHEPVASKLKSSMGKIRQQLIAGQTEKLLAGTPGILRANRAILEMLPPEYWRYAEIVSFASNSKHAFVFLSNFASPQFFASFWFDMNDDNSAALRRVDFFSYRFSIKEVDNLAQMAGVKRPSIVGNNQKKQTIDNRRGGSL